MRVTPVQSPQDWEAARAIRFEVFVDEQQVPPEEELDAYDAEARHWLVWAVEGPGGPEGPIATARAVAQGERGERWKIGRVAVRQPWRGRGVGHALMAAIAEAGKAAGARELVLDSQTHALGFYARLGYVAEGPEFLDAGIPHRRMRRRLDAEGASEG
jgi:predicted GNAT family N-acyltransferase